MAGSSYPRSTVATSASFSVLPPAIIGVSRICLQAVERPVEADKDLPAPGLDSPGGGQHYSGCSARQKSPPARDPEWRDGHSEKTRDKCAPPVRRGYSLFSPRVHAAAAGVRLRRHAPAAAAALHAPSGAKIAKVTSANSSFIIGPETPAGRFFRLIAELLARLIKLLRHLGRRGLILQRQGEQRYARAGIGLRAIVPL